MDDICKTGEKVAHALAYRKGPALKSKPCDPRSITTELLQADRPRSGDEIVNEAV
jgi:hypothetical protein